MYLAAVDWLERVIAEDAEQESSDDGEALLGKEG